MRQRNEASWAERLTTSRRVKGLHARLGTWAAVSRHLGWSLSVVQGWAHLTSIPTRAQQADVWAAVVQLEMDDLLAYARHAGVPLSAIEPCECGAMTHETANPCPACEVVGDE